MEGAEEPSRAPKRLFTFNSREDIDQFATGCDADVGGLSTVNFGLNESTSKLPTSGKDPSFHCITVDRPTGKFWGEMRLAVRHGLEGQIRAGYAGFRSKVRSGLPFTPMCFDDRMLSSLSQPSSVRSQRMYRTTSTWPCVSEPWATQEHAIPTSSTFRQMDPSRPTYGSTDYSFGKTMAAGRTYL